MGIEKLVYRNGMGLFSNKNILLISPESWGINFVSKHHYAVTLAKRGNTVFFLNPPSSKSSIKKTKYDGLYEVDYKPFVEGLRFLPSRLQRLLIFRKYQELEREANCEFDIVWSFDNSVFYDFLGLPKGVLKISHIVDLNQDFQTAIAAKTADVCFGVTDAIVKRLRLYNKNTYKIQHGHFPYPIDNSYRLKLNANTTKVMYIGNLSIPFIDWQVIRCLVEENTDVDFVFIGPDGNSNLGKKNFSLPDKSAVKISNNTYFVGAVSSDRIPSIIQQADILLIAYQEEYYLQAANSHKMIEYLASGKTVLASYTDEYKDKREMIEMVDRNEELRFRLRSVLESLCFYNCSKKTEVRQSYALDNTYNKQVDRIEKIITTIAYE